MTKQPLTDIDIIDYPITKPMIKQRFDKDGHPLFKNGIHADIGILPYHANRSHASSTALRLLRKSPKHYNEYYDKEEVRKTHFEFGNAFEVALLEPDIFEEKVNVVDSVSKCEEICKARLKEIEDIEAANLANNTTKKVPLPVSKPKSTKIYKDWYAKKLDDRYIIEKTGTESYATIKKMLESCYEDVIIRGLIKDVDYQCSVFWTCPITGLKLKTRPDICLPDLDIVVDVKTALDGSPEEFSKKSAQHDYPIQAIMQIDGLITSGKMKKVKTYYWLVVEKVAPYSAVLYRFTEDDRDWVTDLYNHWKTILSEAKKKNFYPGYQQRGNQYGIIDLKLPFWYRALVQN